VTPVNLASLMLKSEKIVSGQIQNPVMTFPINKRINPELFMDGKAVIYMIYGRIKNMVTMFNHWYWLIPGSSKPNDAKRCGELETR